ncbi:MAG: sigma 54-interacting transcriptional regulator [Firmicutes bacterium]|nr:sigma 54-interacting transcriptional regulator [Bacillota bacterium]
MAGSLTGKRNSGDGSGLFAEQLLNAMIGQSQQGVLVINDRGLVSQVSDSLKPVFNGAAGGVTGMPLKSVCRHAGLLQLLHVLKTGVARKKRADVIDGRNAVVDYLPILDAGKVLGAAALVLFKGGNSQKEIKSPEAGQPGEESGSTGRFTVDQIVGTSPQMLDLKEAVYKLAPRNSTVLITGESGTGKELFAQAIHNASLRRFGPLVKINCAAIPEQLLESELFGYEEGAFTGGKRGGARGKLEMAHGGTVFFDEIGELSFSLQAKLLRFLQDREIQKLGGKPFAVDVRVVAATNVHLEQYVKYHKFREDLYYRLNVVSLLVPPLRERKEDIPELVDHFVEKFNLSFNAGVKGIDDEVSRVFYRYHWPGNVRELENVIECAFNVMEGEWIRKEHLPHRLLRNKEVKYCPPGQKDEALEEVMESGATLAEIMDRVEYKVITAALRKSEGNKAMAARLLGITRPCLYKKMVKHGLLCDHLTE